MQNHVLDQLKTQHIEAWDEKQRSYRAFLDSKEQVRKISDILYYDYREMHDAWVEYENLKIRRDSEANIQKAENNYIMCIRRHRIIQDRYMEMVAKRNQLEEQYSFARTIYEVIKEKLSQELKH